MDAPGRFSANHQTPIFMKNNYPRMLVKSLTAFTLCILVFFSCKKDNNSTDNTNTGNDSAFNMSTSAAATDNVYNDVYDVLAQTTYSSATLSAREAVAGRVDGVDTFAACTIVTITPS